MDNQNNDQNNNTLLPSYAKHDGNTLLPSYAKHDGNTLLPSYAKHDCNTLLPSYAKHDGNTLEQTDENNIIIRNIDLFCKFYSEKVLINNIKNISRYDVLRTQPRLSKEFIDNYILTDDDDDITIETLYNYQPYYFVNK